MAGELHPLLAARWSPRCFDTGHEASAEDVALLLDAARWAPSAGNSQPWAFIVGRRGDETHARLVRHLTVQAAALGLMVRQFRAFDREALQADFAIPQHWEATTMAAIGRAREPGSPPPRHTVDELVWPRED